MATDRVKEYRAKHTKKIVGVEGDEYIIRKVPPLALARIAELAEIPIAPLESLTDEAKAELEKQMVMNLTEVFKVLIPAVIVDPPVGVEGSETQLGIDEINPDDLFVIFDTAMEFSELTKGAAELRKSFQRKQDRESDSESSTITAETE